MSIDTVVKTKKPKWLKVKLPTGDAYKKVRNLVSEHKLNTICESGNCPNMGECWGAGTATFMILGNICTRSCGFCAVSTGKPEKVDFFEPGRVANSVKLMKVSTLLSLQLIVTTLKEIMEQRFGLRPFYK